MDGLGQKDNVEISKIPNAKNGKRKCANQRTQVKKWVKENGNVKPSLRMGKGLIEKKVPNRLPQPIDLQ